MKHFFEGLARFVAAKPKAIIALSVILTLVLGVGMTRLSVDADMTDDIPDTVPEKAFYDEVGKIFPADDFLIVAMTNSKGAFAPQMLRQVREWTEAFKAVDGIKSVMSLSSAGIIKGTEEGLVIEDAMPTLPESPEEIAAFKAKVESNAMTKTLIGADGKSTAMLVTLKDGTDAEKRPRVRIRLPAGAAADESFLASLGALHSGSDAGATLALRRVYLPSSETDRREALTTYLEKLGPDAKGATTILAVPEAGVEIKPLAAKIQALAKARGWKAEASSEPSTSYDRITAAISGLPSYIDGKVYVSGAKAVSGIVGKLLISDLARLFPIVILIIAITLYLSFKTLRGVLLPLGNVVITVVWAMGLMGWLGQPISMATMIMPIILIAVGTAYTIHVINRNYEDLGHFADKKEAIQSTVANVALPVFLAGGTTVIGFGSLIASSLSALRMFGLLSAIGIFFAMALSLTFSPAVMCLLPRPRQRTVESQGKSRLGDALAGLGGRVVRHPKVVLGICLAIVAAFGLFIPRVAFESNTINSFKKGSEIRQASEYLNENFTGITVMTIVVRTGEDGAILDPSVLKAIDGLQSRLETLRVAKGKVVAPEDELWAKGKPIVGGSQSITTFVKGINKALNADAPAFDKIPDELNPVAVTTERYVYKNKKLEERDSETRQLLGTYVEGSDFRVEGGSAFLKMGGTERKIDLASGSALDLVPGRTYAGQLVFQYENSGKPETIESLIDNPRRTARVNVFVKTASSTLIGQVQAFARSYIAAEFPKEARADITGSSNLTLAVLRLLISSQISSVLSSLVIVLIFVALVAWNLTEGIVSIIPLTASLIINFGIMGLFGIPIDISTATIASIGIGIGIDYTCHFLERLKLSLRTMGLSEAVVETLRTTGKGIFFNALAVAAGFSALIFSQLRGNMFMGILMALIMITSSIFAITLLPAILCIAKPKFLRRKI